MLPLRKRKERLKALLNKSKRAAVLRYSEHIEGNGGEMFAKACGMGLEGIVSKQADAPYLPGRQRSWLKSKCAQRQEFIIIGYSDARKGERALGALYLGYRTNGKTKYAGKVGTGFSMKSARLSGGSARKYLHQGTCPHAGRGRRPDDARVAVDPLGQAGVAVRS